MAGCTDLAFRLIAQEHGLELCFTEMVSAEALVRSHRKTKGLLDTIPKEKRYGSQLVGASPENMGKAAKILEDLDIDILDLNLGCPVRKIIRNGAGSALLKTPQIAQKIFEQVIKNIKKIPVTAKMRIGFFDPSGKEAIRIAKIAESSGITAITVHGRTQEQGYSGKANWEVIAKVKDAVKIPVFGNGDIFSGKDAVALLKTTGCDGVALGRGALGNPWIYPEIRAVLKKTHFRPPSLEEKKRVVLQHIRLEIKYSSERVALLKSRKIAGWYFKGCPLAHQLRSKINRAQTLDEVIGWIENFSAGT